jgi:hypothetical protein
VLGHAPRKALAVKKASKKGPGKAPAKNCDTSGQAPKKPAPTGLEVVRSPSYERESWWDSYIALSRRVEESFEALKDLKAYVTRLEEECEKDRAVRCL